MIVGAELFGHDLPAPGIGVVVVIFFVGFFLLSRSATRAGVDLGAGDGRRVGHGQVHRCERCGRDFQPEQIELLSSGDVRHFIDERCPGCGWDLEWGSPKKPGGSSGTW